MNLRQRVVTRFLDKKAEEFDLLKELTRERTPEEIEQSRIGQINQYVYEGLARIWNDLIRPTHPGPRLFFTLKGEKWPGKGTWKAGMKGRAQAQVFTKHTLSQLKRYDITSLRDLPDGTPAAVFFDYVYGKDGRWYSAYGYTTTAGKDVFLAKGPWNSMDRLRDSAKKKLQELLNRYKG